MCDAQLRNGTPTYERDVARRRRGAKSARRLTHSFGFFFSRSLFYDITFRFFCLRAQHASNPFASTTKCECRSIKLQWDSHTTAMWWLLLLFVIIAIAGTVTFYNNKNNSLLPPWRGRERYRENTRDLEPIFHFPRSWSCCAFYSFILCRAENKYVYLYIVVSVWTHFSLLTVRWRCIGSLLLLLLLCHCSHTQYPVSTYSNNNNSNNVKNNIHIFIFIYTSMPPAKTYANASATPWCPIEACCRPHIPI